MVICWFFAVLQNESFHLQIKVTTLSPIWMPLTSFLHPLSPSFPSSCLPFFVPSYPPSFLCLLLPHLRDKASRFSPYGANCGYFTDALYLVEGVPFYGRCVESFIMDGSWILSDAFSVPLDVAICFSFFSLKMRLITWTDFQILS